MGAYALGIVTHAKHIARDAVLAVLQEALRPHLTPNRGLAVAPLNSRDRMRLVFQVPADNFECTTRRLSIFFDCQTDHPEYGEDHIALSLGCWGTSVELMKAATLALANLAGPSSKAYVLADESKDAEFVEIKSQDPEVKRLTELICGLQSGS